MSYKPEETTDELKEQIEHLKKRVKVLESDAYYKTYEHKWSYDDLIPLPFTVHKHTITNIINRLADAIGYEINDVPAEKADITVSKKKKAVKKNA